MTQGSATLSARLFLPSVCSFVSLPEVTRPSNSWRGSRGRMTAASGQSAARRAPGIPERLRIVWYWITLIHSLPFFSQCHLRYNLVFVVLFFLLQALDVIMITGCKVNPLLWHILYLHSWHLDFEYSRTVFLRQKIKTTLIGFQSGFHIICLEYDEAHLYMLGIAQQSSNCWCIWCPYANKCWFPSALGHSSLDDTRSTR